MHTYMHTYIHTCYRYICMYVYEVCTYACMYAYSHTHTHIHILTHAHIHVFVRSEILLPTLCFYQGVCLLFLHPVYLPVWLSPFICSGTGTFCCTAIVTNTVLFFLLFSSSGQSWQSHCAGTDSCAGTHIVLTNKAFVCTYVYIYIDMYIDRQTDRDIHRLHGYTKYSFIWYATVDYWWTCSLTRNLEARFQLRFISSGSAPCPIKVRFLGLQVNQQPRQDLLTPLQLKLKGSYPARFSHL